MSKNKSKQICDDIIQVHIDRMHELCDNKKFADAESVYYEIRDWIIHKDNIKLLSLTYIHKYLEDE